MMDVYRLSPQAASDLAGLPDDVHAAIVYSLENELRDAPSEDPPVSWLLGTEADLALRVREANELGWSPDFDVENDDDAFADALWILYRPLTSKERLHLHCSYWIHSIGRSDDLEDFIESPYGP